MNDRTYKLEISIEGIGDIANTGEKEKATSGEKGISALVVYNTVQPIIQKTQQMILDNQATMYASDRQIEQNRLLMEGVNSVVGFGVSMASGAGIAASLGLATGPVGALVGASLFALNKIMDIAVKQNQIDTQKRVELDELSVLRGRAGVQFNKSRGGE